MYSASHISPRCIFEPGRNCCTVTLADTAQLLAGVTVLLVGGAWFVRRWFMNETAGVSR